MADMLINLQQFIDSGLNEAIAKGLENACLIVEGAAKQKCPVGDGQLRQSITHDVDQDAMIGVVGTSVEYAPYVEIGTGIYSSKGNGRQTPWCYESKGEWHYTHGSHPQPFLQPAMDEKQAEIQNCFKGLV